MKLCYLIISVIHKSADVARVNHSSDKITELITNTNEKNHHPTCF